MPYRYWCAVLDEMREMHKTHNYAQLLAYIEELQTLGNRMEAALGEKRDLEYWHKEAKQAKKEGKQLQDQIEKLRKKKKKLNKNG